MNGPLLLLISAIYVAIAVGYAQDDRPGMALCFLGYCIGNFGLIWDLKG